jgi:hypothetical protein
MVPWQNFLKLSVLTLSVVGATHTSLKAQSFPSGTIHIVVAAATGTPPDIISRIVATDVVQENGWRHRGGEQARCNADSCRRRGPPAAARRIFCRFRQLAWNDRASVATEHEL